MFSQQEQVQTLGLVSQPSGLYTRVPEPENESHGLKRKREETVGRPAKKKGSKDMENAAMHDSDVFMVGKDQGEGTTKSSEAKERAGKPTLSGRVPLMPSRLAEGGYQGEKKGVRGPGRKVQPKKKPKSKGSTTKPASKGKKK